MPSRKLSQTGSRWNTSILISAIVILIFLLLPWIFTMTSSSIPDRHVTEEVGVVKTASDLLSPQVWWPLLLSSFLFLCVAFYFAKRRPSKKQSKRSILSSLSSIKKLGILAALSLVAYLLFFLLPFPLHRYYDLRRVSMGWIADRSWVAAITLSFAIVALFLFYYSSHRLTLRQNTRGMWTLVILGGFLFALISFFVFPINSTDLYDYVSRGRISGTHGGNPLVQAPHDYPDDPYVQLAAWKKDPSAYGPLWEVMSGLIGRFAGGRLWNDMLGYKIIAFVSYLLSTLTIASILRRTTPQRSLSGTLLFAWNPLILLEGVANAHNDMIMIAFLLGGFWILSQIPHVDSSEVFTKPLSRNLLYGVLTLIFLFLSVLVKYVPILLLPPLLLYLLSQENGWKRKFGTLLLYLLPMMLVASFYYRVFWMWPEITNSMIHRTEMFRMSLASLSRLILGEFFQANWAQGIAAWFFLSAFMMSYLLILVRSAYSLGLLSTKDETAKKPHKGKDGKFLKWVRTVTSDATEKKPWETLLSACLIILLLYLLLGSLWFWPWYLIWPLSLLALHDDARLTDTLIVVNCAGLLTYVLWNFVWYWMGIEWGTLHVVETLALFLMIIPAFAIYFLYRRKGRVNQSRIEKFPPSENTHRT